jgi:hypothetical protein
MWRSCRRRCFCPKKEWIRISRCYDSFFTDKARDRRFFLLCKYKYTHTHNKLTQQQHSFKKQESQFDVMTMNDVCMKSRGRRHHPSDTKWRRVWSLELLVLLCVSFRDRDTFEYTLYTIYLFVQFSSDDEMRGNTCCFDEGQLSLFCLFRVSWSLLDLCSSSSAAPHPQIMSVWKHTLD